VKAGRHAYRRHDDVEDNAEIDLLAATNTRMEIDKVVQNGVQVNTTSTHTFARNE